MRDRTEPCWQAWAGGDVSYSWSRVVLVLGMWRVTEPLVTDPCILESTIKWLFLILMSFWSFPELINCLISFNSKLFICLCSTGRSRLMVILFVVLMDSVLPMAIETWIGLLNLTWIRHGVEWLRLYFPSWWHSIRENEGIGFFKDWEVDEITFRSETSLSLNFEPCGDSGIPKKMRFLFLGSLPPINCWDFWIGSAESGFGEKWISGFSAELDAGSEEWSHNCIWVRLLGLFLDHFYVEKLLPLKQQYCLIDSILIIHLGRKKARLISSSAWSWPSINQRIACEPSLDSCHHKRLNHDLSSLMKNPQLHPNRLGTGLKLF